MNLEIIGTAYTSLQFIRDSIGLALSAKIDEQTRAKIHSAMDQIIGLQDGLFQTQQQLFSLQQENQSLKRQLEAAQAWESRTASYRLIRAPGSAMVYEFEGEPHHYACPNCFEQGRISVLQDSNSKYSGPWPCKACNQLFLVSISQPINPRFNSEF